MRLMRCCPQTKYPEELDIFQADFSGEFVNLSGSRFKLSSATSRVEGFKFCQILNPHEMPLLSVLEGADLSILSRSMYLAIVCPTRTRDQRF